MALDSRFRGNDGSENEIVLGLIERL
jgi:hypothetical protein